MFGRYKAGEVTKLIGLSPATIRTWRAQGCDFGRATGTEAEREHVYGRLGLLSLAIVQQVREAGASLEQAWGVAFWGAGEVAQWAGIPNMDMWKEDAKAASEGDVSCQWLLMVENRTPVVTNDPAFWLASITGRNSDGTHAPVLALTLNLRAIAERLPPAMIAELKNSAAIPSI